MASPGLTSRIQHDASKPQGEHASDGGSAPVAQDNVISEAVDTDAGLVTDAQRTQAQEAQVDTNRDHAPVTDETQGWAQWLDRHGATLAMLARQWCKTQADAEDIVQDAFVKFWRSRDRARDPAAYLYTCVKTTAIDWTRARMRRDARKEQTAHDLQAIAKSHAEHSANVSPLFETMEAEDHRRAFIEAAMRSIPDDQREVLIMKIWGGLTFQQIGEAIDVSPNTAASRYRYALKAIRKALKKTMPNDPDW